VHLGTGNYHARTARIYTDYGLLTCDKAIGEDVNKLFHQLTGLGRAGKLKKLAAVAFYTLHKGILTLHRKRNQRSGNAGKKGWIIAKMNALVDPEIIAALYKASQANVKDRLDHSRCLLSAPRH
jgi:polyphosphate kinase